MVKEGNTKTKDPLILIGKEEFCQLGMKLVFQKLLRGKGEHAIKKASKGKETKGK